MDYTFKAPSLAIIGKALAALQASGLVGANSGQSDMLGPLLQVDANDVHLFRYGMGMAAITYTMPDGAVITRPAIGEPGMFYVAIRTDVPPSAIPFDAAALGLIATTPNESAAVLGGWF